MDSQQAIRFVPAAPQVVLSVLLQPRRIPDWNPAFLSLTGPHTAAVGVAYPITVRGRLSGTFRYSDIAERCIGWTWTVAGLREVGTWRLTPEGDGTRVHHEFAHHGPLALVLRSAFDGVGHLRLDRLALTAVGPASRNRHS